MLVHFEYKTCQQLGSLKELIGRNLIQVIKYAFNPNDYQFSASIMFKLVRKVVAGPKRTTVFQGNQLDLTYITQRIIAMAFPASDIIEKTYRNNIEDVVSYFNQNHRNSYMVMNVSSRIYDYDLFDQRVKDFEWPDHQAPTLPVLVSVAFEMYSFLRENKENVVAVHCNHGKGRTGTAIISFLLLIGYSHSASQCLKFYNSKRFNKDTYGVDQPCQVRYLGFLQRLMEMPAIKKKLPCFHLTSVTEKGLNENYFIRIKSTKTQEVIYDKVYINQPISQTPNKFIMSDIFIELFSENWMGQRRISRVNYNMYFIQNNLTLTLKGSNIKVDHGHSKQFEVILSFQYHCLCHLPEYSETLCPCNYTRNFQQLEWESMIEQISICKKLTDDDISFLVHGYKLMSNQQIDQLEFERITKNQENSPPKLNKTFRNSREQKLYALSQAKKHQHEQYFRQNSDPSPSSNKEFKLQDQTWEKYS